MTPRPAHLVRMADAVLLPCFDGLAAPDWIRRRVGDSLGGVCYFARNIRDVEQVAALSASLVAERESVVISIDEEAGDVTRMDSATGSRFPGAAALGRVDDPAATEQIAREVGTLLAHAGVSVNFAPCADVAINPASPVIGSRSFGRDPALVARQVAAWTRGHQSAGVAACLKHFPGHGDTDADSHHMLAVVEADLGAVRRDGLPPFIAGIRAGTAAVMTGHLLVPAVDADPASISHRWTTDILRGELGFTGTVITDALEMRAIAARHGIPGGAVAALHAGADVLCIGGQTRPEEEIDHIRDAIVDAVLNGRLDEARLADAARRAELVGVAASRAAATEPAQPAAGTPAADSAGTRMMTARREAISAGPVTISAGPVTISAGASTVAARAVHVAGDLPTLTEPVTVLLCSSTPNIAVGVIPWGPATVLGEAARQIVLTPDDGVDVAAIPRGGSVLVVTRDRHRHEWMCDVLGEVRRHRPDAVLVEMGTSGVQPGDAPAIASFGGTLANTRAVVDALGAATRGA